MGVAIALLGPVQNAAASSSAHVCGDSEHREERWAKYTKITCLDDMENMTSVHIVSNKTSKKVDLTPLQKVRSALYKYAGRCTYAQEIEGKLIVWDLQLGGEDYDCGNDSQTSAEPEQWSVPRFYRFDPRTKKVSVHPTQSPCHRLFDGPKMLCVPQETKE